MSRGSHRWLGYEEERAPCGSPGLRWHYARYYSHLPAAHVPSLDDCLVSRPRLFSLVIWEPLLTKAPAPPKAKPYCCYIRTVIFYHSPYIVWPWPRLYRANGRLCRDSGPTFLQWDQVETRLTGDDLIEFEGELFEVGGGSVVWARKRWWMVRGARRQQARRAA